VLGVKVWIFKGEVFPGQEAEEPASKPKSTGRPAGKRGR
jgi:ribosomal protein S3